MAYGLSRITPVETLEKARKLAIEEGLEHVYVGNVPGNKGENTYCPSCGRLLIKRYGYTIRDHHMDNGCCAECGMKIQIVGARSIDLPRRIRARDGEI